MKAKKVELYSGSGKLKGTLTILPIHLCGLARYSHHGELLAMKRNEACADCPVVETRGGRTRELVCLHPKHYGGRQVQLVYLTAPEKCSVVAQLGDDAPLYVADASVHGAWKRRRNQGAVVVPKREGR